MAKRILVIDDDEGILEGFKAILESEGYDVIISPGTDYIQSISKAELPDLILLDVLLSGQDGRKICKKLKQRETMKHIPILMMSAAPDMEKSTKKANADGFLRKPFEMDEMLETIATYVNKSR